MENHERITKALADIEKAGLELNRIRRINDSACADDLIDLSSEVEDLQDALKDAMSYLERVLSGHAGMFGHQTKTPEQHCYEWTWEELPDTLEKIASRLKNYTKNHEEKP